MNRFKRDILFKETPRAEARGYFKLKKQTGGPGQFAIVDLVIRPLPRDGGFRFRSSVVEGRIPADFVPSVEKGAREALLKGPVAGHPVVDVEVELLDGDTHRKDSHARDFQIAGREAVQAAMAAAQPAILEPLARLEIGCPVPSIGFVMGRLSAHRSRVRATDFRDGLYVVVSEIPLLELDALESEVAQATSGQARFSATPAGYDVMP